LTDYENNLFSIFIVVRCTTLNTVHGFYRKNMKYKTDSTTTLFFQKVVWRKRSGFKHSWLLG